MFWIKKKKNTCRYIPVNSSLLYKSRVEGGYILHVHVSMMY